MSAVEAIPIGVGIYSFADAARLIGSKSGELRRWMLGYDHKGTDGELVHSAPLWVHQLADDGRGIDGIGFRDLLELRFVRKFREAGVPLQLIRRTLEEAQSLLSTPYPFTCKKFRTDGKRIFMSVVEETGDESLIDLVKRQNVIEPVIGPSLRSGIEFEEDMAARWFPIKNSKAIVLDPARSFGQPILVQSGIPTVAIAEAVVAEGGDESVVGRLFEISKVDVRRAVDFEARIAARDSRA